MTKQLWAHVAIGVVIGKTVTHFMGRLLDKVIIPTLNESLSNEHMRPIPKHDWMHDVWNHIGKSDEPDID